MVYGDRERLRAEREVYRSRIRVSPLDREARSALAVSYRARGNLDQAGRWGLLVPGGSTSEERRQFARYIVRSGEPSPQRARRLLLVPSHMRADEFDRDGLFEDFLKVVASERRRWERTSLAARAGFSPLPITVGEGMVLLCVAVVAGLAITGLYVIGALFIGADIEQLRIFALVGVTTLGVAVVAMTVSFVAINFARRRRRSREAAR